ncbi:hypothetical protein L2Z44_12470 [Acinetobacter baumannii]|uniref:hypothetical protein n=1 Tax=Acinetobacter baumannii TaxID=470 RepID=UPI001F09C112|nr:hypothetical protein [Acinetobacter baumannii]UMO42023.1 hypothetical protein L2Z44_12470 [Acinetobacter baumannii]
MSLKSEIQAHLDHHSPFETIDEFIKRKYKNEDIVEIFTQLHNENDLDLIQVYSELKNNKTVNFFIIRHLLTDALPNLKIKNYSNLLKTLEIIIIEAGDDLMSHSPLDSFEALLDTNLNFACDILEHLKSNEYKVNFTAKTLISIAKQNLALCLNKAEELILLKKIIFLLK